MTKKYFYAGSCVECTFPEALMCAMELAVEITYLTFRRNCKGLDAWAQEHGYAVDSRDGLTLANDVHVTYHRTMLQGRRAYIMYWSAQEHIWTQDGKLGDKLNRVVDRYS